MRRHDRITIFWILLVLFISSASALTKIQGVHTISKDNQSIAFSFVVPTTDFNGTMIYRDATFLANISNTTGTYNFTGLSNNTCYFFTFRAFNFTSGKAENNTEYQCTLQNNVNPFNSTNMNAEPFLFRTKYQTEQGLLGGEVSQRIFALDCNNNPTFDNICYAGTDTTTAWRWNGTQWFKIARNVTGVEGVSSIVGDYNNPNYVCAWFGRMATSLTDGTYSGLWCSKDAGITWTQKITSTPPRRQNNGQQIIYQASSYNGTCSRNILAGADNYLYNSSNCGDTWTQVNIIHEYTNDLSGNDSIVYWSTNTSLFRVNWSNLNATKLSATGLTTTGNALRDCAVNLTNAKQVVCGSTDLYESWNSGSTFSLIHNPSGSVHRIYWGLNTMIDSPDQVGGEKPYYSTDGGATWANSDLNVTQGFHVDDTWFYAGPISCFSSDSKCFSPMSSGGWMGISEDYGATFNDKGSSGMTGYRVVDMQWVRQDLAYVAGWDMGLRLTNTTTGYTIDLNISASAGGSISAGFVIVANWTSPTSCVIVTTDGTWSTPDMDIIRSTNCGQTWSTVQADTGHQYDYGEVCKDNNNIMVAGYDYTTGGGYYSVDNGATWTAFPAGYFVSHMDDLCNIYALYDAGSTLQIFNASRNDYSTFTYVANASTTDGKQYGGVIVDPHNTSHFFIPNLDTGIFECKPNNCTLRAASAGLPATSNYKWVAFDKNNEGKMISGKIPNLVSGFPAYPYCSFDTGDNWQQCLNNLGDMPSYWAFYNPYETNGLYFSAAGLWKATSGVVTADDTDFPPLGVSNLGNVSVTNDTIAINWTVAYHYGDENNTFIYLAGVFVGNVTKNDYIYTNYSLQPNTSYRFDVITTDNAGNKGTNGTITITTLPNNTTDTPPSFPMILNNLIYTMNFSFLQKPYFFSLNITGNNTQNIVERQAEAYYSFCTFESGGPLCNAANNNDWGSENGLITSEVYSDEEYLDKSFYNYANYSNRDMYLDHKIEGRANAEYSIYCLNTTGYQLLRYRLFATGTTWETEYYNQSIPTSCRQGSNISIRYGFDISYGSAISLKVYEIQQVVYPHYYINFLDSLVYNSTNTSNVSIQLDMTNNGNAMTGDKFNVTFGSYGYSLFDYNVSYAFLYNKTINVSVYNTALTDILDPTCDFNDELINPKTQLVTFNSSHDNIMTCALQGYFNVTANLTPTYDAINLTMDTISVNITIYDEHLNVLLNYTFGFEFFNGDSLNYTTINGSIGFTGDSVGEYKFNYWSIDNIYPRRTRFVDVTNLSDINIRVYALNTTWGTYKPITVIDESGQPVVRAKVRMLREFVDCNCFRIVEEGYTDETGYVQLFPELYSATYKFMVIYEGETKKVTDETTVDTRTLIIPIKIGSSGIQDFFQIAEGVYAQLDYDDSSATWTYSWVDDRDVVESGTLEIKRRTVYGETTLYSQSSSGTFGSLTYDATAYINATGEFIAKGYVTSSSTGTVYKVAEKIKDFTSDASVYGLTGVFLSAIIIIVLAMVGIYNPVVSIILTLVGLIIVVKMGLLALAPVWIVGIIIVGLIFSLKMKT